VVGRLWGVLQPSEIKVLGLNTAAKLILSTPKVIGQTFRAKIGKIIAKEKVWRFEQISFTDTAGKLFLFPLR
jgi:hypothetical protein